MKDKQEALKNLDSLDVGVNTKQETTSFTGWHDVKREDLPYGGIFWAKSIKFQVQPANAGTIAHYSAMDETNPLSVQAALTHMIKEHIRVYDGTKLVNILDVVHESMRFWFCMLVHSYTGNATALEVTEKCPSCQKQNKITITPFVIEFQEATEYVTSRVDSVTGHILQQTKSFGELRYQPITLSMRAELLAFMQEKYQKKENFDMQFLSYAPLLFPLRGENQSIDDVYKKLYYPLTQDHLKFSVFTSIIRKVALDQLLTIQTKCSSCDHRFQVDISATGGLSDIFLNDNVDGELL